MGTAKYFEMTLGETHIKTLGTIQHIAELEVAERILHEEVEYLKELKKEVDLQTVAKISSSNKENEKQ